MQTPRVKPTCKLINNDSNAFSILSKVSKSLKKAGADNEYINQYLKDAKSGDYDNLLSVISKYVKIT